MTTDEYLKVAGSSVHNIPGCNAAAVFTPSGNVFREQGEISPQPIGKTHKYMPWGGDNQMPYDIIDLIERDETLTTCQSFSAEALYGAGLVYNTDKAAPHIAGQAEQFAEENALATSFLGACIDFKHFGWSVAVIILNKPRTAIRRIVRKEVCYCRFSPADASGRIRTVHFANWREDTVPGNVETVELLDPLAPLADLRERVKKNSCPAKFAVVTRIPTVDSTYYPIPPYASLFRGKWYNIKQLIGTAKEANLKNSAPIKYQIEISNRYWDHIFALERITDPQKRLARVVEEKERILDFLTGAENSGKAFFSQCYTTPDGKETHDVTINKIDNATQGGDWATDIQEAVNMICFASRVHSNLVGSVPGKAQSNNSGSDKRELYTIAQAIQKPYRDLLLGVHRLVVAFNGWKGVRPQCPFVQLTTLDEHTDARNVSTDNK